MISMKMETTDAEDGSSEGESEDSELEETEEELKGSGEKSDSEDKAEEVETQFNKFHIQELVVSHWSLLILIYLLQKLTLC